MRKSRFIFILLLIVLTGCTAKTIEDEDFSSEYYKNFTDIKNIIYYLGSDKDSVTILSQNENQLIFCFTIDNSLDIHDESILSYANYIRNLELEGYQLTILDATISSTFKLEKDHNAISITLLSNTDEYKTVHHDISNIDKITNENIFYELVKQ